MSDDMSDPPRLENAGHAALRELVHARRLGPSVESIGKMATHLTAAGVMPSSSRGRPVDRKFVSYKLLSLVVVMAGGTLVTTQVIHSSSSPAPKVVAPSTVRAAEPPREIATPPAAAEAFGVQTISVDELPAVAPVATTLPPAASSKSMAVTPAAATPNELALVQRAEASVTSNPAQALAFAEQHARAFPNGEYVQEREVIAVTALARLGRSDEALSRARSLVRQFPRTPYAARLTEAVGAMTAEPKTP